MADCERLMTCPFFSDRMENMPKVAELIKQTFCHGDKTQCAPISGSFGDFSSS